MFRPYVLHALATGEIMIDKFEDFGAKVKAIRAQLSISQEDFAHAPGGSFATVHRWENGKNIAIQTGTKTV